MASGWGRWQAYEKTSNTKITYPSVARFTGHVQFKGVRPRTADRKGEHTRPACRGGRPRPPFVKTGAAALQLHRFRAAPRVSPQDPPSVILLGRCVPEILALAPISVASGSISRCAEKGKSSARRERRHAGRVCSPWIALQVQAGEVAGGENRRPACPAGCPTRCRCLGRDPLQGYTRHETRDMRHET
jgi:hypothetical protein